MNVLDFMSDDFNKDRRTAKIEALKKSGLDDYAIERKLEETDKAPEKLEKFTPVENSQYQSVIFYFNNEDYLLFTEVFETLEYVEVNSNQTWLLMGLIKLVKEGHIMVSYAERKVWVN